MFSLDLSRATVPNEVIESLTPAVGDSPGFEGPEKRLEVYFRPASDAAAKPDAAAGLRTVERDEWSQILLSAQCSILSLESNMYCDAYLLSESSLFVYSTKLMIKTCGTTTLLKVIPHVLQIAEREGLVADYVQYSRASFTYPNQQLHPHTSFQSEVDYLNGFFSGESYVLGTADGATQWHLYIAGECQIRTADQGVEVFMFDLDQECMQNFFNVDADGALRVGSEHGAKTSKSSGISALMAPGSILDAYNFEPCGYSMNGLEASYYYTIHITPEPHCSYVSFECNLPVEDFTPLLQRVLQLFRPKKFTVALHADIGAPAGIHGLRRWLASDAPWDYQSVGDSTFLRMKTVTGHEVTATLCSFVTDGSAPPSARTPSTPYQLRGSEDVLDKVAYGCRAWSARESDDGRELIRRWLAKRRGIDQPVFFVNLTAVSQRIDVCLRELVALQCSMQYAVSHGADLPVLQLLGYAGCRFEVGTAAELTRLSTTCEPGSDRIVLSRPAVDVRSDPGGRPDVRLNNEMDEEAIHEIAGIYPGSSVELHLVDPLRGDLEDTARSAVVAVQRAVEAGLCPVGISFGLDPADGANAANLRRALEVAHRIFSWFLRPELYTRTGAARTMRRLCIGSSFPGASARGEDDFVAGLRQTMQLVEEFFPLSGGVHVALDPGRSVVSAAYSLLVPVVGRRDLREGGSLAYYISDGMCSAMWGAVRNSGTPPELPAPICLNDGGGDPEPCEVLGASCCDRTHRLFAGTLPRLNVGDCLLYPGAEQLATLDDGKRRVYFVNSRPARPPVPLQLLTEQQDGGCVAVTSASSDIRAVGGV